MLSHHIPTQSPISESENCDILCPFSFFAIADFELSEAVKVKDKSSEVLTYVGVDSFEIVRSPREGAKQAAEIPINAGKQIPRTAFSGAIMLQSLKF